MQKSRIVSETEGRHLVKFFADLMAKTRAKLITAESMLAKAQALYGDNRELLGSYYDRVVEKSDLNHAATIMHGIAMDVYFDGEAKSLSDAVDVWSYLKNTADEASEVMLKERSRYGTAINWAIDREIMYQRMVYENAVDAWSDVSWMTAIMHNVVNRMAEREGVVL